MERTVVLKITPERRLRLREAAYAINDILCERTQGMEEAFILLALIKRSWETAHNIEVDESLLLHGDPVAAKEIS